MRPWAPCVASHHFSGAATFVTELRWPAMDDLKPLAPPKVLSRPHIRLHGEIADATLGAFLDGLASAETGEGPLVVELMTTGGDAEVGRRLASEIRHFRERTGRPTLFYGKAVVYSAGVTVMSGILPVDRWLAEETMLLIHCRKLDKTLRVQGSLRAERIKVEALLGEIEAGMRLQEYDFQHLISGSDVSMPELLTRTEDGWYLTGEEALERGLIAGVCRPGSV